ncbi:hypothetical protein DYB30_006240 [Aphanomyces astaci]|uniref:4-hydroxybenzoate polyprenyl transferase n=2 Tax=Aphanomyces astaci TaxID=112090 RepID=A0A397DMG9_APHAT|nr:hypothetical protein DYB38_009602 [Aphanomyces astaci]RHY68316.1 hypothetical protein DYB30_006240 [Aphanomyces astaci]RHZ06071.1 hypothetical protein DYB31_013003 [Aphanomyces astaci]
MLLWPCFWSTALAAPVGALPDPTLLALFATGSLIMRSAGCTINDMWDKDFDKQVERTNQRPLASGALTYRQAWTFLGVQLSAGLAVLLQLNPYTIGLGVTSLGFVVAYPYMKRITYWPQAMLGLTFNYALLFGDHTQPILNGFTAAAVAGLASAGYMADLSAPFYMGVGLSGLQLAWQVNTAKLDDPVNLQHRFGSNKWFGAMVFASIVAGKVL